MKCLIILDTQLHAIVNLMNKLYVLMFQLSAIPRNWVNIELPAEESDETSVFIISNLTGGQASTWLPIHARYHHSTAEGG